MAFHPRAAARVPEAIREALHIVRERGAGAAAIGLAVANPLCARLRRAFRAHAYRTCIETVTWPATPGAPAGGATIAPDGRPPQPEIALL